MEKFNFYEFMKQPIAERAKLLRDLHNSKNKERRKKRDIEPSEKFLLNWDKVSYDRVEISANEFSVGLEDGLKRGY